MLHPSKYLSSWSWAQLSRFDDAEQRGLGWGVWQRKSLRLLLWVLDTWCCRSPQQTLLSMQALKMPWQPPSPDPQWTSGSRNHPSSIHLLPNHSRRPALGQTPKRPTGWRSLYEKTAHKHRTPDACDKDFTKHRGGPRAVIHLIWSWRTDPKCKIHSWPKRDLVNHRSFSNFANKPASVTMVRYELRIYFTHFFYSLR